MQLALIAYSLGIFSGTWSHPRFIFPTLAVAVLIMAATVLVRQGGIYSSASWDRRLALVYLSFFFVLGFLRHLLFAQSGLLAQLPSYLEGVDLKVNGYVAGLPRETDFGVQYLFSIETGDHNFKGLVLLSDYETGITAVHAGQRREMFVRMNRPHGTVNPGSFDREAGLFRQGIAATGYVRSTLKQKAAVRISLQSLRQTALSRLRKFTANSPIGGIVEALTLGERGLLTSDQDRLFSQTGTSHLIVISGLHIGLVAGAGYGLISSLLYLLPVAGLWLPRQKLAKIFSLLIAVAYSAMAGFTLPTLRALVMLLALLGSQLFNRKLSLSLRWLLALAVVLTHDPLATQSGGFWFSFIGVAGLMLLVDSAKQEKSGGSAVNEEIKEEGKGNRKANLRVWFTAQFNVFVALSLPLLFLGFPVTLMAPFINLLAIPALGIVVVPLSLLFSCLAFFEWSVAAIIFSWLEQIVILLLQALNAVADSKIGELADLKFTIHPIHSLEAILAALAIGLMLFPSLKWMRLLAAAMLMPLAWPLQLSSPSPLRVDVVDVGQGLAVIVRTKHHTLVYDTGNGRDGGFSSGQAIIAPVLKRMGVNRVDRVVISHGDTDHAGGLSGLLAAIPSKSIVIGEPNRSKDLESVSCHGFDDWKWDGVAFRFLAVNNRGDKSNSNSCILKVSVGSSGVLLPGDIGEAEEKQLVNRYGSGLKSALLISPHHGSRTSSSYPFLKIVKPEQAVFSVGYKNRFNHPAAEIVQRYSQLGVKTQSTAQEGMLSFEYRSLPNKEGILSSNGGGYFSEGRGYRKTRTRYWRCHQTCR